MESPAKNRRDWATSFILVDQLLDPGSQGGFRQTIITSPGARFSKVPIINGPGKLLPFTLKTGVSVVLHLT